MLDTMLLNQPLMAWTIAAGVTTVLLAVVGAIKWVFIQHVSRLAQRTTTRLDNSLVEIARATRLWLLFFPAALAGSQPLALPEKTAFLLQAAATVALLIQAGLWLSRLLEFWLGVQRERTLVADAAMATSLGVLRFVGKLAVWTVILLMALDNFGVDITALIAGLGVGGIAVALAVQNILGDLFASLSIVIDKPFVLGDFIVVDEYMGTVEHVGLKTTRIRSLGGEQIVFGNNDLLKTRIRNYKRMQERRILFGFGVVYQTPPDALARIPELVRDIIAHQPLARFDRAHFKGFGESAYDFEVVYWMQLPDYNTYMDTQQAINLQLVREFARAGIEFAYPTRTLFMHGQPSVAAAHA
jgi:small-conductance mechanosensitive channel